MSSNVSRLCTNCGRRFIARKGRQAFCSLEYKKRYGNHTGYRCATCRTLPCEYRDPTTNVTPENCHECYISMWLGGKYWCPWNNCTVDGHGGAVQRMKGCPLEEDKEE